MTGGAEAAPVAVLVGGSAYARLVGSVAGIVIAPGDPVFRRHLVVEAAGVAVIRFARGSVVGEVIAESSRRAGQVGIGSEFQQTLRDRADSSGRNLVSREWRAGGGVGDRRQSGEIAGLDRRRGLGRDVGRDDDAAQPFEGGEEEQLVVNQWAAHGSAEFIAIEGRLSQSGGEKILGREPSVAVEFEQAAVILVGSGFGLHQHLRAAAAEFGGRSVTEHLEFLDGLERGHNRSEPLITRVDIGDPIDGEIRGSEPDAAGDQRILARGHHTGSEGEKPVEVAPSVERHLGYLPRVHYLADRRCLGLHDRRRSLHLRASRHGADFQAHIHANGLVHEQVDVTDALFGEARGSGCHPIRARFEIGDGVLAVGFCRYRGRDVGALILDGNFGPDNGGGGGIAHGADNDGAIGLSHGARDAENEKTSSGPGRPEAFEWMHGKIPFCNRVSS